MVQNTQSLDIRIGSSLRAAREERHLAVSTLAEQAQMDYDTLIAIENGAEQASAAQIFRLSKILGIELKQIFRNCCKMKHSRAIAPFQTLNSPDGIAALVVRMRTDTLKTRAA